MICELYLNKAIILRKETRSKQQGQKVNVQALGNSKKYRENERKLENKVGNVYWGHTEKL